MKVWEAVQMLKQMDQTKEVTVTFGAPKNMKPEEYGPAYTYIPSQPSTVWRQNDWPKYSNEITCGTIQ